MMLTKEEILRIQKTYVFINIQTKAVSIGEAETFFRDVLELHAEIEQLKVMKEEK